MATFIYVTNTDDEPVLVNCDHVITVSADTAPDGRASVLRLDTDYGQAGLLYVKDKLIDLALHIGQAGKGAEPRYIKP